MKRTWRRGIFLTLFFLASMAVASAASPTIPTFSARRDYPSARGFVVVADVNGDGIPDVVSLSAVTITTLLGNGDGTFSPGPSSTPGGQLTAALPIDINGDGKIDLLISAYSKGLGVCFGNGDGTFQPAIYYPTGSDIFNGYLAVGDFNGDGIPDVAMPAESGIWLFTGTGGGVFDQGVLTTITPYEATASSRIVAADFNGDGNLDIAVTYLGTTTGVAVLFGRGNGTFHAPEVLSGTDPNWIAVGDLNRDGRPDVVVNGVTI
jgi:hypothetical protein